MFLSLVFRTFCSYLECGSLYIYREFNSLPKYQLFNEVVIDEIGWVDFYASLKSKFQYDGRRSRQHAIQAEKEIILYTVLTVCYDVFSGFAHYTNSSQQPLDSNVLSFLFQSVMMKFTENVATDSTSFSEVRSKPIEFVKRESDLDQSRVTKVFLTGTRLLFIDVADFIGLLAKRLHGKKITNREKRKIKRTLHDIVNLVPITIIMIIPVSIILYLLPKCVSIHVKMFRVEIVRLCDQMSAVGHAAVLAAINKYIPSMIPSPYSSERLNLVRQFKRIKKMQVESWAFEDKSFTVAMP
ncbi:hypothetical protein HanRHA438_Chr16g0739511 [Helianthus annuus]|nr:hypothetical protein HanRHA438_Chr16g0739511 [Helianthus annuus]